MSAGSRLEELEALMRPGVLSQNGFLGDNENLEEVLAEDRQVLKELGVTHAALATALESLIEVAEKSPDHSSRGYPFHTTVEVFTGFQICPWATDIHHGQCTIGGGSRFANLHWCIKNTRTGQEMCGPGLIVHLIRDHQFFEGMESPQRVDPRDLAKLLDLVTLSDESE